MVFSLLVLILVAQYRADFDSDVSPLSVGEYENCLNVIDDYDVTIDLLSQYVDKLDSQQQSFLHNFLPDPFSVLTKPQEITENDFKKVRTFLKNYLQAGRFPGFNNKALSPQAADLCRSALS